MLSFELHCPVEGIIGQKSLGVCAISYPQQPYSGSHAITFGKTSIESMNYSMNYILLVLLYVNFTKGD